MWYSTETKAAQIGLTTMFSVLTITDIAGNAVVCLLIIKFKDMKLVVGEAFTKRNNYYNKGRSAILAYPCDTGLSTRIKFAGHRHDKYKYEIAF